MSAKEYLLSGNFIVTTDSGPRDHNDRAQSVGRMVNDHVTLTPEQLQELDAKISTPTKDNLPEFQEQIFQCAIAAWLNSCI